MGRRCSGCASRLRAALPPPPAREPRAAATDGGEELLQVDLERREDLVGVVLGAEADLALGVAGVLDDLLGPALGLLVDLLVGDQARLLLARLLDDPLGLPLRLGEHLLALLDDPPRLLDLLGDRRPHLIEQVVDLLAVDPDLIGQRHGARVVHEVVELVYEDQYVHYGSLKLRDSGQCVATVACFAASLQAPAQPAAQLAAAGGRSCSALQPLGQGVRHRPRDEVGDVAPESRHLLHPVEERKL